MEFRIRDLKDYLHQMRLAMDEGVDVRGFFYWSLLDNFEWQFGYAKKFGLVSVDFDDPRLPRRMTQLGEFYREICAGKVSDLTGSCGEASRRGVFCRNG